MLVAVGLAYAWAAASGLPDGEVRALGFASVVFGNLALILATRSRERTLLAVLARPNPALWWIVGGTLAALAGALYVPAAADLFRFAPLGAGELAVALGAGLAGIAWLEALKLLRPAWTPPTRA
jgi:Ca2+-transporting ATPase